MIDDITYRDPWLFEKATDIIGFYPREFYCLDNFSAFKVEYKGHIYATAEEAYQAAKFNESAPEIADSIRNSFSAHEAKRIAFENMSKQRSDWDDVKLSIMEEILRAKVNQNPYVRQKLLESRDYKIVEDSPKDSFWGWGYHRSGFNMLGKLWMKIREELKNKIRTGQNR